MNRNFLKYLEIHLVDHCNLNCKGCGHFSTLSPPSFLGLVEFEKDLKQLKKHFEFIGQLRLMGGEPLLHPECSVFFNVARRIFGDARISLVTNGILLPELNESFYRQLREQNIEIQITFYSETFQDIEEYSNILNKHKINFQIEGKTDFKKHLNFTNSHSVDEAIEKCRIKNYCPALKNGKIYQCSGLANFEIFKTHYNMLSLPTASGIDIYRNDIDFQAILEFIDKPDPLCSHCYYGEVSFPWDVSSGNISEWII